MQIIECTLVTAGLPDMNLLAAKAKNPSTTKLKSTAISSSPSVASYVADAVKAVSRTHTAHDIAEMYKKNQEYEVRADGQKKARMLTFAFYGK
jgi:hypothetical protein